MWTRFNWLFQLSTLAMPRAKCLFIVLACTLAPLVAPAQNLRDAGAQRGVLIGAAVDTAYIANDTNYANILAAQYSMIEAEAEMKWLTTEPSYGSFNFGPGDILASYAQAHQMKLRGHNLLWHAGIPAWLTSGEFTPAQLYNILQTHITAVVTHFKGVVFAWDVVNEALADGSGGPLDSIWYDQPGIGLGFPAYIDQAFIWAHAADPNALLFYNDYGVEDAHNNPKSDAMYNLVKGMLARGVPINGVGLEFHIVADSNSPTPAGVDANIQRLTALGLQVHVTELDVRLPVDANGNARQAELATQAQRYHDIVSVCIKYPGCTAIQTWGFTDKYSWIPEYFPGYGAALPYDVNYQPKPAWQSLLDAITATPPSLSAAGIVNAASYQGGGVAPGEIVTIFGANAGPPSLVPALFASGSLSNNLSGVQVLFDGVAAPVVYAQLNQTSVIVPFGVAGHSSTTIQYSFQGMLSAPQSVAVVAAAPGIFAQNASGSGPGAILNQDNTVNSAANPAPVGSVVQVFATGGGLTKPPGTDGVVPAAIQLQAITPMATIGGATATVQYAGVSPGTVAGIMQVNVQIPQVASGPQPIVITMGAAHSQSGITVEVK